ncbi:hypothetical protein FGM00_05195 [Aggregatimonas sangjinii]|uniref:Cadherin domain-containing protein n=1 Tax=Aggregatimonas sangjinii TaxID=2583587 RepID=A0A5B7SSA5_9FLAO|nr:hypothetical protein [Aggregatimonas sangjinii]QCW99533.1 hypothetical protein FGM00_05195 [Aggregatimonas sangjinii]
MKTFKPILSLLMVISTLFFGCENDDDTNTVDSVPEFTSLVGSVSSLPGLTLVFEGTITDPAGIKTINFKYEPWFLDKTIVRDSVTTTYDLSYQFKVPEDEAENSVHTIPLTVTNTGGETTTQEVTVTLDLDVTAPSIQISQPIDGATVAIGDDDEIIFDINVTDESLSELKIESSILNETLAISGASYNYTNSLDISSPDNYVFTITATDMTGNTTTQTLSVNVVDELKFLNMYLVDTNDVAVFDSVLGGYPYAGTGSSVEDEEGFVFSFRYYAEADDTAVFFIAQRASFEPFAFGDDPESEGQLAVGSDASVPPITLPASGYYDIAIDLRDLSYSTTLLDTPTPPVMDADFTGVYMTGTGLIVNGTEINAYNPATSAPLEVDPNNPQRYTGTVEFNADNGSFIFVGNQANYNVFWRVNNGPIPTTDAIVPQGGTECLFDTNYPDSYRLTVDLFLNTFTITKI